MTTTRNNRGQFAKTIASEAIDEAYDKFSPYFDSIAVKYPTAGVIVNIVVTGIGVYAGLQFASYIAVAAALMTGSMLIAFLVGLFAAVIGMIQALRVGAVTGRWISTGQFEYDYQRTKTTVLGWFSRKETAHV